MHVRIAIIAICAVGGALLPVHTIAGEVGRLLIIPIGFITASLLPTVTLLLQSMTASGRSVLRVNQLKAELRKGIDTVFSIFALAASSIFVLVALNIPTPPPLTHFWWLTEGLERSGQSLAAAFVAAIFCESRKIPGIIRRSLDVRAEIAVDEARRKTVENAPKHGEVGSRFKTRPGFGQAVKLEDLQNQKTDGDPPAH